MANFEVNRISQEAPNGFFQKLEQLAFLRNKPNQKSNVSVIFDESLHTTLDQQLRDHISNLHQQIVQIGSQTYHTHFVRSLTYHAQHMVSNTDEFRSFTDYIQFGLATQASQKGGDAFRNLFQSKVCSVLFSKWRLSFLKKRRDRALSDLYIVNFSGKQVVKEWQRSILQRKLKAINFHRTQSLQKFYKLFKDWEKWNRQQVYVQVNEVRRFRKTIVLKAWLGYLEQQGHVLMKIIKAQRYYENSLMSKGLLALFKSYLEKIRVKKFMRKIAFKRYFKSKWMKYFKRNLLLKKLLARQRVHQETNERQKYLKEFEIKKEVMREWAVRAQEKQVIIKELTAEMHFKKQLAARTFFYLKELFSVAKGVRRLHILALFLSLRPAFERLRQEQSYFVRSELVSKDYRKSFLVARTFNSWKEHSMKVKIAKLNLQRKFLRRLQNFVKVKNYIIPIQYRQRRLMYVFILTLKRDCEAKWQGHRSDIIIRQLSSKAEEKLKKQVFLKFLENLLHAKQERMKEMQAQNARRTNLNSKAFKLLKRRWLKRKKRRLMNMVARDFNQSLKLRKEDQLRESLISITSDYDVIRLRDNRVLDDQQKMIQCRVIALWKMYVQERVRKSTLIDRFLLFKKRMTILKTFLAWRSISKYENSTQGGILTEREAEPSPQKSIRHNRSSTERNTYRVNSVRFADQILPAGEDTRQYLFGPKLTQDSLSLGGGASATFGQRSLASQHDARIQTLQSIDTPQNNGAYLQRSSEQSNSFQGTSSLFGELEAIFTKNRKWLDEQREREEFLKEMASHYNQRLSSEMRNSTNTMLMSNSSYRQSNNNFSLYNAQHYQQA